MDPPRNPAVQFVNDSRQRVRLFQSRFRFSFGFAIQVFAIVELVFRIVGTFLNRHSTSHVLLGICGGTVLLRVTHRGRNGTTRSTIRRLFARTGTARASAASALAELGVEKNCPRSAKLAVLG